MTNQEFISLVAEMRILQRQYYKIRTVDKLASIDILRKSKAAELAVDKAIQQVQSTSNKQTSLF
jgi:hypothetical protein